MVGATSREDITIAGANLLPTTRVELDGRSWSLIEPGPVVRSGQSLQVPLAGALVVGDHELVLVHYADNKELRSEPLTITVEAATLDPLLGTLDPELVGAADRLVDVGPGQRLLALVDDGAQTVELRLGDWSAPGVVQNLPGLVASAGPASGGQIDVMLTEAGMGAGSPAWVVTSWLADGGQVVRARITELDLDGQLGEPGPVLEPWSSADPALTGSLGPHELAVVHGVAALDRMLVVAVEARRDAELLTPGDDLLVTRWLTNEGSLAAAEITRGPGGRDLDLPRRATSWLDLGERPTTLSVRVARAFPWLLEVAGNGLPLVTSDPGEAVGVPGSIAWFARADGALGATHVFAIEFDGDPEGTARVRVLRIDRWGTPSLVSSPVDELELPAIPTSPPSLGSIAGSPTLLIPFGVGTPAWSVRSTGEGVLLDSLASLDCDVLTLEQAEPGGEGEGRAVACVADRELRLGTLALD